MEPLIFKSDGESQPGSGLTGQSGLTNDGASFCFQDVLGFQLATRGWKWPPPGRPLGPKDGLALQRLGVGDGVLTHEQPPSEVLDMSAVSFLGAPEAIPASFAQERRCSWTPKFQLEHLR